MSADHTERNLKALSRGIRTRASKHIEVRESMNKDNSNRSGGYII
jgi:hypothetical protein